MGVFDGVSLARKGRRLASTECCMAVGAARGREVFGFK